MTKRHPSGGSQPQVSPAGVARLNKLAPTVAAWHDRSKYPVAPEPGSSLAADSMRGLNVDNPLWYSMCIASEHLHFALESMRATRTLYPTAYITVARTAFVAAVNAVWVLAPKTRSERRKRALNLRADDLIAQIKTVKNMPTVDGVSDEARAGFLVQLQDRQAELQSTADALGIAKNITEYRLNQTEAIKWVARNLPEADDEFLAGAINTIWHTGSAAAHAQYHYGVMRMDRSVPVTSESGNAIVTLSGDLNKDVVPPLEAGSLVLSEAFRLYDLRRVAYPLQAG